MALLGLYDSPRYALRTLPLFSEVGASEAAKNRALTFGGSTGLQAREMQLKQEGFSPGSLEPNKQPQRIWTITCETVQT